MKPYHTKKHLYFLFLLTDSSSLPLCNLLEKQISIHIGRCFSEIPQWYMCFVNREGIERNPPCLFGLESADETCTYGLVGSLSSNFQMSTSFGLQTYSSYSNRNLGDTEVICNLESQQIYIFSDLGFSISENEDKQVHDWSCPQRI